MKAELYVCVLGWPFRVIAGWGEAFIPRPRIREIILGQFVSFSAEALPEKSISEGGL